MRANAKICYRGSAKSLRLRSNYTNLETLLDDQEMGLIVPYNFRVNSQLTQLSNKLSDYFYTWSQPLPNTQIVFTCATLTTQPITIKIVECTTNDLSPKNRFDIMNELRRCQTRI